MSVMSVQYQRASDEEIAPRIRLHLGLGRDDALTTLAKYFPEIDFRLKRDGTVRMKLPRELDPSAILRKVPAHLNACVDGAYGLLLWPKDRPSATADSHALQRNSPASDESEKLVVPQRPAEVRQMKMGRGIPLPVVRASEALGLQESEELALLRAHRSGAKITVHDFQQSNCATVVEFTQFNPHEWKSHEHLLRALGFLNTGANLWNTKWRKPSADKNGADLFAKVDFSGTATVTIRIPPRE
jgi:hypothetical protein